MIVARLKGDLEINCFSMHLAILLLRDTEMN